MRRSALTASGRSLPTAVSPLSRACRTPGASVPPLDRGRKTLAPGSRQGYNPHSLQASGAVQPVLSGVLVPRDRGPVLSGARRIKAYWPLIR